MRKNILDSQYAYAEMPTYAERFQHKRAIILHHIWSHMYIRNTHPRDHNTIVLRNLRIVYYIIITRFIIYLNSVLNILFKYILC
jgi:hypothetical protein